MKEQAVETNGCRGPTVNKLFSHTRTAFSASFDCVSIFDLISCSFRG